MSWFDTSGIANLAKSALKEAQKTIDKALDIKEDENRSSQTPKDESSNNFFATWGIKSIDGESDDLGTGECAPGTSKEQHDMPGIWGSFTGSFFDNPQSAADNVQTTDDPAQSLMKKINERMSSTKENNAQEDLITLAEPEEEKIPKTCPVDETVRIKSRRKVGSGTNYLRKQRSDQREDPSTRVTIEHRRYSASEVEGKEEKEKSDEQLSLVDTRIENEEYLDIPLHGDPLGGFNSRRNTVDGRDSRTCPLVNRASIVSSGSDKKSSESVEILDSRSNTNTSTPDSEITSPSISTNPTQHDTKRNSDSVEILPDSLVTSPSSVEILGDSKSENDDDSPLFLSTIDRSIDCTGIPKESVVSKFGDSSSDVSPYISPIEEEPKKPSITLIDRSHLEPESKTLVTGNLLNIKNLIGCEMEKESPESVEVIPDVDELDEVSQAEDSYTSASETTVMTIMDATMLQQFDPTNKSRHDFGDKRMHDSCPDSGKYLPGAISGGNQILNTSLDSSREKHNLHLPLEPITTQPIRKGEPIVEIINKALDSTTITKDQIKDTGTEPPEINPSSEPTKTKSQIEHIADCPEQYLMLTDSSCEGTLIESSSEDNAIVKANEPKIIDATLTSSSYVKNMLADAMVEKGEIQSDSAERQRIDVPARENSPISSESRSDLVKIGSDQTSGHTSGDELETTTSSDIEIISSPNGDSSSTQSRQSPANLHSTKGTELLQRTLKTRGHSRELSEISVGSDDGNFEVEKLLRRTQEMTEILQVRESKLIDVSRMNMELHEQNIHLKKQLDSIEMRAEQTQELNRITEDYTQRLSALEKKFQQAISERDSLRDQLDVMRQEASARLSSRELLSITAEKDDIIKELREEGEKLSKQQLQHSNIIKKLRAKEKENETLLKSQKEQLEEQSSELERLKRSLYAKEEIERTQIEAVHTLTARIKKQETDILSLQEKLDNALNKMDAYKTSLDATKIDSANVKAKLTSAEEELKRALENAGESCQLAAQVEDLKHKLRQSEEAHVKSVTNLKRDNNELLKRLEISEARNEELSESVTLVTKPLLRQLEQLQSSFALKASNFSKQEKLMSEKIDELQSKLESLVTTDRSLVEENVCLKKKLSSLEAQIKRKDTEKNDVEETLKKLRLQFRELEQENSCNRATIEKLEESHEEEKRDLKREIQSLTDKLSMEKAATNAEKRKNNAFVLEQQQSIDQESRLSPTLSIGRDSIGSTSSVWPAFNESLFESGSGRFPSVYESLRTGGNSTSIIENLQAQVKQRDGEIQQLQWEISRRNNERDILNMELSSLTFKIEELTSKVAQVEALNESLNEIQTRYDALLQMYGEKIEETQELRLDLEDVKAMYKSQIDQLLKRET
ncbi:TATA element modulatory factor [Venturia canescens]|uniref:TATA element modulatory factor n=1 Tax=Venturia canescens TaxID=32260 RepID=UPI001C9D146F|nr:TATA element modulatory factor [Venturia canescens]XP_043280221.1 TATA element modulatory factor [Venturia canescens]XP_043280222.1 TATA element modulatory factor [Venturia canescens]